MSSTTVAADLRAIEELAGGLEARAIDLGGGDLPGGAAMVNLARVASMIDWTRRNALYEATADPDTSTEDPDELWPPFQMLRFWSEQWRVELGMDYADPRWSPSLTSEAAFLRNPDVLAWAWDNEPGWDDFARDVATARRKLEAILRDGEQVDRVRVVCEGYDAPEPHEPRQLIWVYADGPAEDDMWKCPRCKRRYDADGVQRLFARQLRSAAAERFVPLADAVSILAGFGHGEGKVRRWAAEDAEAGLFCEVGSRRLYVLWSPLWRRHLEEQARRTLRAVGVR